MTLQPDSSLTHSVYIVGSGPSLKGFNWKVLGDVNTIAVNDAVLYVPNPTLLFSGDIRWVWKRLHTIPEIDCEKVFALPEGRQYLPIKATVVRRGRELGLSEDKGTINVAGVSGFGAINLAYQRGYSTVTLLGFDMGLGRFYEDGVDAGGPEKVEKYKQWARNFNALSEPLTEAGVQVVNASPQSVITAFPKVPLSDLFQGELK